MKISISDKARGDLRALYLYFAGRDPMAAESILKSLDTKLDHVSRFPFLGRERTAIAPNSRSALAGTHLIFYRVERDGIRMDIDQELQR